MKDRAKLFAILKALAAKTVANGCTEAEALAALEMFNKLMADNEVTADELKAEGETIEREEKTADDRDRIRQMLVGGVSAFCQCAGWRGSLDTFVFLGLKSDVIFAHWLLDTLADFVKRGLADYLQETWRPGMPSVRRLESTAFVMGCCETLAARLHALAETRDASIAAEKGALIKRRMQELGIKLEMRGRMHSIDPFALSAGEERGAEAQFSKPIHDRAQPVHALRYGGQRK